MRTLLLIALTTASAAVLDRDLPVLFRDDFAKGSDRWQPTDPNAWKTAKSGDVAVFQQHQQSKYTPSVRSPLNIALVKDVFVGDFVFEAKAQSTGKDNPHRDMCIFWGYQDPSHFYYAHLAKEADDRANQIFIVNGKDRAKISLTSTKGTAWDDKFHRVKVTRDAMTGDMAVFWDDMKSPIMTAKDLTFTWGRVGIGSFDDTGMWADVKLSGDAVKKK